MSKSTAKKKSGGGAPGGELRLEYMKLGELLKFPGNPKEHNLDGIGGSIERWGFNDPIAIDERSGFLSEGHGRLHTLRRMRAAGEDPPEHVRASPDGSDWLVPVVRGASFKSKGELERYIVAHNQTTIAGGWTDEGRLLAGILARAEKAAVPVEAMGFDKATVKRIMVKAHERVTGAGDESTKPQLDGVKFKVIVECSGEKQQGELAVRLEREGFKVSLLMS